MLLPAQSYSRECAGRGKKPANRPAAPQTQSLLLEREARKNSSKLNERTWNVFENKGPVWKNASVAGKS
jgi:hypothetical protein